MSSLVFSLEQYCAGTFVQMFYCEVDLSEPPAAYMVIDGREPVPSNALTAEEHLGLEIDSIVRQAHEEHEEFVYKRGIEELSKRAILNARPYPSYANNIPSLPGKHEEGLGSFKRLLPEEDLGWLVYFPF